MHLKITLPREGYLKQLILHDVPGDSRFCMGSVVLCDLRSGTQVIDFTKIIKAIKIKLQDNTPLDIGESIMMIISGLCRVRIGYKEQKPVIVNGRPQWQRPDVDFDTLPYDFEHESFQALNCASVRSFNLPFHVVSDSKIFTYHLLYRGEHRSTAQGCQIVFPRTEYIDKIIVEDVHSDTFLTYSGGVIAELNYGCAIVDLQKILQSAKRNQQMWMSEEVQNDPFHPFRTKYNFTPAERGLMGANQMIRNILAGEQLDWKDPRWNAISCEHLAEDQPGEHFRIEIRPQTPLKCKYIML